MTRRFPLGSAALVILAGLVLAPVAAAAPNVSVAQAVADHWTPARMAAAVSRDRAVKTLVQTATPTALRARARGGDQRLNVTPLDTWKRGGALRSAIGRLYFEMTFDGVQYGFVCSGTVVDDELRGYSTILTAAHCIYDDASSAFAENVMFIPNQAGSTSGTDLTCANDALGCWIPTTGAVDPQWDAVEWPDNLAYDYGFYLVPNVGRHVAGLRAASDALESAVHPLDIAWSTRSANRSGLTFALGYPFDQDPALMYCAEAVGTIDGIADYTNLWLPNCALGEGASGGPWLQPEDGRMLEGDEHVFSLNSWGNDEGPGMAGPVLQDPARGIGRPHALFNALSTLATSPNALIGTLTTWF